MNAAQGLDDLGPAMAEGYGYLDLPFRSRADDQVAVVIQRFASADEAFRDALRDRLSLSQYDVVLAFAIRMAMLAVRERSTARLRLGAQAVALAGDAPTADWRETAQALLPLRDAATRLGGDAQAVFADAARLARGRTMGALSGAADTSALMAAMERFVTRLGVGVWKAIDAPDGFRYVPTRRVSRAEVDELIRRVEEAKGSTGSSDRIDPG